MRVLGWVLAAVLVLPFVQAAAQLAVFAAIGLFLLFALRQPQEALAFMFICAAIGLINRFPVPSLFVFGLLGVAGMRAR